MQKINFMSSNGGLLGIAKESHKKKHDTPQLYRGFMCSLNEKNPNAGYAPTLTAILIQSTLDVPYL